MQDYHVYESYTRPHMEDMQRQADRERLAAMVTVPARVRVGRLLVRVGERLLHNPNTRNPGRAEARPYTFTTNNY
jgi:hypothetical protein